MTELTPDSTSTTITHPAAAPPRAADAFVTKTTESGRAYEVSRRKFVWHPEDDEGEVGNLPDVVIPLRMKLGLLRGFDGVEMNTTGMFRLLDALIPNQAAAIDDMDTNDFQLMFAAWQTEYNESAGATLGESGGSSA